MKRKRCVIVICDGLRADFCRPEYTPNLCQLMPRGRYFLKHRGVFPSTTRVTSASIATGCYPARHGLQGNTIALDEGNGLVPVTAGSPDFRNRLLQATGSTLHVPTLAQRLKSHGGQIVFSNVSAGAAYFQDPDGYGHVYHRDGSFGPGLKNVGEKAELRVPHDAVGDTLMTSRFIEEVLKERKPACAVLWQCEPDHSQHSSILGSPGHLDAIYSADSNVGKIVDAVASLTVAGEDILLLVASDHGHETVEKVIDLEALLIEAGFKESRESSECVVASQGLSAFIYLSEDCQSRLSEITLWLKTVDGIGSILTSDLLESHGQRSDTALAIAVDGIKSNDLNILGITGKSNAFLDRFDSGIKSGHGQHGGLGVNEQNPFLIAIGEGFKSGSEESKISSAIDLAPTILYHLGLPFQNMDGAPLQFPR